MKRRGKRRGVHHAGAPAGFDEGHVVVPANLIGDADALVELDEVGADAEENMLAVVDHFAGSGMLVGGGASAKIGTALEERDAETGVGKSAGGGEAGESAAGDGDSG